MRPRIEDSIGGKLRFYDFFLRCFHFVVRYLLNMNYRNQMQMWSHS